MTPSAFLPRLLALGLTLMSIGVLTLPAPLRAEEPKEVMNFALIDHHGDLRELRRSGGKAVVLFFTANGCPVARQNASKVRELRERYSDRGVSVFMVNSSIADDRRSITKEANELRVWHVPVLKDDSQGVARHLGVTRTAEAIAISTKDWSIFYRGAIDDQMVEGAQKPKATKLYLEKALDQFLQGQPVQTAKTVARGCKIEFDAGEGPDSAPVSYATTIVPLLEKKCVHCHSTGNIGSWAMTQHKKVKSMASMIEEVILTRRMPPWDADPSIGHFSNDSSLSIAEQQTLLRWIHQGAPRGEGTDPLESVVVKQAEEWPLGKPDIILRLPKPQKIAATGVFDYRHITVLAGNEEEAWVGACWVKPGNRKVVHHVIARLKDGGRTDALGQRETFVGWAPGTTQGRLPEGTGKLLPKNARFDIELHYTANGSEQTDESEVGLYLLPSKPARRFESVPMVNVGFEIKPGDPDSQTQAFHGFKNDATLYSVTPHMHLRGKWMRFDLMLPNGKRETLCSVPRYDFAWQQTYMFKEPKKVPAGSWIQITGGYDNSSLNPANPDPKKTVHWGDQSFDEMFLGYCNVAWEPETPKHASR